MAYRILSTCAGLGYGFDESSFREAVKTKLDLIAADAGSVDPGPYYLGKGVSYMERPQLKRDFKLMLLAALEQGCPLITGSCGLAGDTAHLELMVDIAEEVFEEEGVRDMRVAVIDSHMDNDLMVAHMHEFKSIGRMPPLTAEAIKESAIVGQMGIAPFIKALDEGAQVILAGRSCDVAIFAADPIRRGMDPGLAFHAAHILECGAMACDPASGSDGLIAEFTDDGSVVFIPPNRDRKTTVKSIAAHTLYEESHPSLQSYPEGVLNFQETEYFQHSDRVAGIRNTVFINRPLSVKIEGSRKVGERVVSILFCDDPDRVPERHIVYGRNGVEARTLSEDESETGILFRVSGKRRSIVESVLTVLKGYVLHFGYPGRRATAGNLAFPISPSQINYRDEQGRFVSLALGGSRDPLFQEKFDEIRAAALSLLERNFPELFRQCDVKIEATDRDRSLLFLETVAETTQEARALHGKDREELEHLVNMKDPSVQGIYAGEAFQWSMFHTLANERLIKESLFPIALYRCRGRSWECTGQVRGSYDTIGVRDNTDSLDETLVDTIVGVEHQAGPVTFKPLVEMATVIRSKNAGVNRITFEVFFNTDEDYAGAIDSNAFVKEEISRVLGIPLDRMIGSYRADPCNAIKISAERATISGTPGDRDVFGAQQHMRLASMKVPIF
ncbi:MAG: DUF4387 family protein [Deltaproteobacteria bacterium]|nr:DUF4387 family protein [Deltaproteobacteria bacterium]